MHKNFVFLKTSTDQVCQSLKTAPLASLDGMSSFCAAFNSISAQLRFGILPRPERINALGAGLWLTKMRVAELSGHRCAAVSELERLVDLLGRVSCVLKECWIYRKWTSSRASSTVSVLAIVPAFLMLWLVSWAGGSFPLCSVMVACFPGVTAGVSLWIKDPVGIFWSLYSCIPLYILVNT